MKLWGKKMKSLVHWFTAVQINLIICQNHNILYNSGAVRHADEAVRLYTKTPRVVTVARDKPYNNLYHNGMTKQSFSYSPLFYKKQFSSGSPIHSNVKWGGSQNKKWTLHIFGPLELIQIFVNYVPWELLYGAWQSASHLDHNTALLCKCMYAV